jgi:hypothetical protein
VHHSYAESLIGLYKLECVRPDGPWRTVEDLELATLCWVHWFNNNRLHSALDHVPLVDFEEQHYGSIIRRAATAAGITRPLQSRGRVQRRCNVSPGRRAGAGSSA